MFEGWRSCPYGPGLLLALFAGNEYCHFKEDTSHSGNLTVFKSPLAVNGRPCSLMPWIPTQVDQDCLVAYSMFPGAYMKPPGEGFFAMIY